MYVHNRIRICLIITIEQSRKCSFTAPSKIDFSYIVECIILQPYCMYVPKEQLQHPLVESILLILAQYRLTLRPLLVSMVLVTTTPLASTVVACLQNINCKCLTNAIQSWSCTKTNNSMQLSYNGYTSPFSVGGCPASIKIISTVYVQRLSHSLL